MSVITAALGQIDAIGAEGELNANPADDLPMRSRSRRISS